MKLKRMHWLADTINNHQFKVGVEVGAATGITTEYLLKNCKGLTTLYIADDWRPVGAPGREWAKDNMESVFKKKFEGEGRIKILKGLSWEGASFVKAGELDFAFIDASHDYESVKKDLDAWTSKVRSGGMMCGHDIHGEEVQRAVTERFGTYTTIGIDHCWAVMV